MRVSAMVAVVGGLAGGCAAFEDPLVADRPRDAWEGELFIEQATLTCDPPPFRYEVRTAGWGEVTVQVVTEVYGQVVWDEAHELEEIEVGPDWARYAIELEERASVEDYVSGETTLLPCDARRTVTFGMSAWTDEGEFADCVAWGLNPEGVFPRCAPLVQVVR